MLLLQFMLWRASAPRAPDHSYGKGTGISELACHWMRLAIRFAECTMQDFFSRVRPLLNFEVATLECFYSLTIVEPLLKQFNRPLRREGWSNAVRCLLEATIIILRRRTTKPRL